jgi:hypothetical protein
MKTRRCVGGCRSMKTRTKARKVQLCAMQLETEHFDSVQLEESSQSNSLAIDSFS